MLKVAIASDHGGFALKDVIKERYTDLFEFVDLGTDSMDSVDYPDFAQAMGRVITEGSLDRGILICGTGIGISIAANRFPAVRAALCTDVTMARLCREHNDANVLTLGARVTGEQVVFDIVETFFEAEFEGGRHATRVNKINQ